MTTSWLVYSGADPDVIAQAREDRDDLEVFMSHLKIFKS
jgi:hypothetical protein